MSKTIRQAADDLADLEITIFDAINHFNKKYNVAVVIEQDYIGVGKRRINNVKCSISINSNSKL